MAPSIPNRGPELLAVNITFVSMATMACGLRCFVRIHMVKGFGLDDWLMVAATSSFICYISFSIAGVHNGTGRHHIDLPLESIQRATNYWWYCYLFYCLTMIASKLSIGFFLLRIAIKKIHAWIIYGAMFISVVAGAVFFFVTLFQCRPISYFWNKGQDGSCISIEIIIALAELYSAFSIISDFTFALLPTVLVWNLQLKRRTKLALIPLLTMGCIASSAVVVRTPYLLQFRNPDFLWATLDIAIWSTIEQGLAVTAGSLATLRPLFQLILARLGFKSTSRYPSRSGMMSPGASQILGGGGSIAGGRMKKGSKELLDEYNLSTFAEEANGKEDAVGDFGDDKKAFAVRAVNGRNVPGENIDGDIKDLGSSTWFGRSKRGSTAGIVGSGSASKREKKVAIRDGDAESQRSLQSRRSRESLDHEISDGMGIMVSTSVFVTREKVGK